MKKLLSILLLIVSSVSYSQKISPDSWKKDIEYIKQELPKLHPNPFFKISNVEFERQLDSIRDNLSDREDIEIIISLQEAVAKLGDGHTSITYRGSRNREVVPINFNYFSDGIYAISSIDGNAHAVGKKLIAINDIPQSELIDKLSRLTSRENNAIIRHWTPRLLSDVNTLRYFGIIKDTSKITYTLQNSEGTPEILEARIARVTPEYFAANIPKMAVPGAVPLYLKNPSKLFWSEFIADKGILYVQYNKCSGKEMEEKYGNPQMAANLPSFQKFADELLAQLEKPEVKKLVFDMRFNGGGSSLQGTELVLKIAQIKNINKKGKIFVVIGRQTFSSAILNSLDFKNHTHAILVGEPTSGRPNHYGQVKRVRLPNTGLTLNSSTKYFSHSKEDTESLIPDKLVELSFKDYTKGIDPVMEAIERY